MRIDETPLPTYTSIALRMSIHVHYSDLAGPRGRQTRVSVALVHACSPSEQEGSNWFLLTSDRRRRRRNSIESVKERESSLPDKGRREEWSPRRWTVCPSGLVPLQSPLADAVGWTFGRPRRLIGLPPPSLSLLAMRTNAAGRAARDLGAKVKSGAENEITVPKNRLTLDGYKTLASFLLSVGHLHEPECAWMRTGISSRPSIEIAVVLCQRTYTGSTRRTNTTGQMATFQSVII